MIIIILGLIVIVLLATHIFISINEKKRYYKKQKIWSDKNSEIITPIKKEKNMNEEDFFDHGKIIAHEQKINLLNKRIINLEKTITEIIKNNLLEKEENFDYEKINFRIKVLEKDLEELKNPVQNKKTFFGKEDFEMEKKIRALAFNSKKN